MNELETDYFKHHWKPNYSKFKYSGWALLDKIKEDDTILDIGCGYNLFKEKLGDRLWGIDPANDKADEMVSLENYTPQRNSNVYFILGSLNFGDQKEIETQLQKLADITKTGDRVYWRQNTFGNDHPFHDDSKKVRFFLWSRQNNSQFCEKYNFTLNDIQDDATNRLYAEWIKN